MEQGKTDFGSVAVLPSGPINAGIIGTWQFVFTIGSQGLQKGGGIRLLIPNGFSPPIVLGDWPPADSEPNPNHIKEYIPTALGFVTGHCSREDCDIQFTLADPDESFKHAVRGQNGRFLFCTLIKGQLQPGEEIKITYGDTATGSSGASTPSMSHIVEFSCAVDIDGKRTGPEGGFWPLESLKAKVIGGDVHHWECVCASQQGSDGKLKAIVIPRDRYDNPCYQITADLDVTLNGQKHPTIRAELEGWNQSVKLPDLVASNKGVCHINIHDKQTGLSCRSNPVQTGFTDRGNIYWGDLHCHTAPSFERNLVEEFFDFARDVSMLDFCAYTPHEDFPFKLTEDDWQIAQEVTASRNLPGELVTFVGYEFRNKGDWIVLYEQEGQPFMKGMTPVTNTQPKLLQFLAANVTSRYMLIPHLHYLPVFQEKDSGLGVLDVNDFTSEIIRGVEIYSMHGSAEYPGCPKGQSGTIETGYSPRVRDILAHVLNSGPKLGFTGSSDTHTGNPGSSKWLRNRVQYGSGLTAVCAHKLNRSAIWEAIWNHRTYATTGVRMLIDFEINGIPYGGVVTLESQDGPRNITVRAVGTDRLDSITIVRNGKEVHKQSCKFDQAIMNWVDKEPPEGNCYYYARILQNDGHLGWTSPVWFLKQ